MSAHEPFSSVLKDESLFSGLTVHEEGQEGDITHDPGSLGSKRINTGPRVELSLYQLASIGVCYNFLHAAAWEDTAHRAPDERQFEPGVNLLNVFEEEAEEQGTLGLQFMVEHFGSTDDDYIGSDDG